jgi:lipoate-protein ligase A
MGVPVAPVRRSVRVLHVDAPALVLGSTQAIGVVDARAASRLGVEVVRRRSGGGAVVLRPGETVWVDVVVPAGDPLWSHDVGHAFHWLGDVWHAALGVAGASVHRGPLVRTALSPLVCFAGTGPGEVMVGAAKLVGMASRRTRDGALFQCAVPLGWDAPAHVDLLALPASAVDELAGAVYPLTGWTADQVVEAFLAALPPRP